MQFDKQTRDLNRSCLRLRDGLLFAPQHHHGDVFYHIENPATSKFYRIGYPQYIFVSLLDGTTSFSSALALTARELGSDAITEAEANQLSQWLLQNKLATFADDTGGVAFDDSKTKPHFIQELNPFWMKWAFGSPDAIFSTLMPSFRWMFSPVVWIGAMIVHIVAAFTVAAEWQKFSAASDAIFSPTNWIYMLVTWVLLKLIHEFAHGIACKHYGGSIRETGLIFILFAPMAFVDVTSSWRFESKWRRITVAAAGMFVELLIASIAIIAWSNTKSELTAQLLYNVFLTAGLSTILFNANPLMRFDGYFILSDLLEIPNLYEEGSKQSKSLCSWLFFGDSHDAFTASPDNIHLVRTYGLASSIWKLVICASLLVGASAMFHGAGIVLGIAGSLLWFGKPAVNAIKSVHNKFFESRPAFFRASAVSLLLVMATWYVLTQAPNPTSLSVPCIVDYERAAFVRAGSDGFLDQIFVKDGQFVAAGAPLVQLRNEDLEVDIARLQSELRKSLQRAKIARDEHEPSSVQIELEQQRSIRSELEDRQREQELLAVVAPVDGHVVSDKLESKIGAWLTKGDDILVLGNESRKELLVSISHNDIQDALPRVGDSVRVRVGSRAPIRGTLARVEPRATSDLSHEAFAATAGGPIPVTQSEESTSHSGLEFHAPRFTALVALSDADASQLFCGERGWARVGRRTESLGAWGWSSAKEFIEERTKQPQ